MDGFLSDQIIEAIRGARRQDRIRRAKWRVLIAETSYPIVEMTDAGFSIAADRPPAGRGYVEIYDGSRRIGRPLVVLAAEADGVVSYEFKIHVGGEQAPADYVAERPVVAGRLTGPVDGA